MGATASTQATGRLMSTIVQQPTADSSYVVRHRDFGEKLLDHAIQDRPDLDTVYKIFAWSAEERSERPFMGTRAKLSDGSRGDYEWITYAQAIDRVDTVGNALVAAGVKANDAVGVFSINREEWVTTLLAIQRAGSVCVPLYDTLGAEAVNYIVKDAKIETVLVSGDNFDKLMENIKDCDAVHTVVCFDTISDQQRKDAEGHDLKLYTFEEFCTLGRQNKVAPTERKPEDLMYNMYTSGTTGNPKGVLLSQRNFLSTVGSLFAIGVDINENDVYLSYLPLAHCFEALVVMGCICAGASLGFYQGNVRLLTDDIAALRPTIFVGVPRVYSRIYDKIQQTIEGSSTLKQLIFKTAYDYQLAHVNAGTRSGFWDALVFNKIKERLGGRIRIMATGAAPMPAHIMDFLKVAFGCAVFQGYGMTENAAGAVVTPVDYINNAGKVGEPLPACEVKLADVPEMNYLHSDTPYPRGEVCIRGHNVFRGYHNLPDKTKEALDEDGWLHTGDIGQFLEDGALQIIDRKKNIFKLAQGEYVAAEELEGIFKKCKYVGQIWIYGNSFHTTLIAVIVPDPDTIMPWCKEQGIQGDFATATKDERVNKLFLEDIRRIAKADKVASFKVPQDIIVESEINELNQGFSTENDCLTPTFKLRRPQLKKRYEKQIDAIYIKRDGCK
ncbi:uncharacterized protein MONBRDRAFT_33146 [Monosiga brevicollis MX1]|uniref:AMP-dependent synthetase/ligase domain-containing protein n=1 Tax=Monosiga brevicollis TaxID=81824 RepID=A9V3Z1_MONBE|nr:uncharacterized protein MONBRDRAFT_33146 [Monosiga brevicollis MX1]EDQ87794.1 predicted protein [Monosiga brevicollis MX1]|eukprot:XP_001747327.1 hypothetical protein [Monosiga brevicollis MX1]